MRRLIPLLILTLACNLTSLIATPTPIPTLTPTSARTPTATLTPTVAPTPTATPALNTKRDLYIESSDILIHPDGALYSGDVVSIEAIVHDGAKMNLRGFTVELYVDSKLISRERASGHGIGQRLEASFEWAWRTTGLGGAHTIQIVVDPDDKIKIGDEDSTNNTASVTVNIQPRSDLPFNELDAKWIRTESECCIFNYIANSPAARDIELIKSQTNDSVAFVESRLGRKRSAKLVLNFIDRVLGHGGFAGDTITITYMDRDYPAGSFANVVRHEAAHILARPLGKERPILIEEGFATYITGGHFKPEPFAPRAAGLVALDRYIPLAQLADNFYPAQHELGYLESAGFIEYLVNTYGWEKFVTLLGAFQQTRNESAMLDAGLRFTYNKKLSEIESDYLAYLKTQTDPRWTRDIENTIRYYDTVRLYQKKFDPSAYYLTAWIPDIDRAVRDGLTADYQRHPLTPRHIAIETMLIEADRGIDSGD
ncbi:MAG: CARDB domain-containing protein, partial [Chloroflexota bacterium]